MKRRSTLGIVSLAVFVAIAAVALSLTVLFSADTTLEFYVRDAVSGKWVWDLTAQLEKHEIRGFYQSDESPAPFRFVGLVPGKATLALSAPAYEGVVVQVNLRRGVNRLYALVDMIGVGIPNLSRFIFFENLDGSDIVAQIRPVDANGKAVLNHPCVDLWIGCRIYVQMKNGVPVREPTESGSDRGEELFRGRIPWQWDPAPETVFRYSTRISGAKIRDNPSLYRVIDYLVVVPDPRKISEKEVEDVMSRIGEDSDYDSVAKVLKGEGGRLRFFLSTSWNVKARQE